LIKPFQNKLLKDYLGLYNYQSIKALKEVIKDYNPDVIHFNNVTNRISFCAIKMASKFARVFFTARAHMAITKGSIIGF
jgi:hypothetical protein